MKRNTINEWNHAGSCRNYNGDETRVHDHICKPLITAEELLTGCIEEESHETALEINMEIQNKETSEYVRCRLKFLPIYDTMTEQEYQTIFMSNLQARHAALLMKYDVTLWFDEREQKYRAWVQPKDRSLERKQVKRKTEDSLWERVFDLCEEFENRGPEDNPTLYELYVQRQEYRIKAGEIRESTRSRNDATWRLKMGSLTNQHIRYMTVASWAEFYRNAIEEFALNAEWASRVMKNMELVVHEAYRMRLVSYTWVDVQEEIKACGIKGGRKTVKKQTEAYDLEDQKLFKDYLVSKLNSSSLHSNAVEAMLMMFITGLRCGEVVALQGADIEIDSVTVRKTEVNYKGADGKTVYELSDAPKTDAGYRTVPIPENWQWFTRRIKMRLADDEFFCKGHNGRRMYTCTLRDACQKHAKKAGVKNPGGPHKIRRSYISALWSAGVDKALITKWVGHVSEETTTEYYVRNVASAEQQMDMLNRAIS